MGASSFELASPVPAIPRLIVSIEGQPKTGKTHWALTAPPPIGILDFDTGLDGVVDTFAAEKEIHIARYPANWAEMMRDARNDTDKVKAAAGALWAKFIDDYEYALGHFRSVIVDSTSQVRECIRLANLGKLEQVKGRYYGQVNLEDEGIIRMALGASGVNVIFISRVKKQYKNDNWNGSYERSGLKEVEYGANVVIETIRNGGGPDAFAIKVRDCRKRSELNDTVLESPCHTFAWLASQIYDQPPTEWE